MSVKNQPLGYYLFSAVLAISAGALGSFLTLLATNNLQVPVIDESGDQISTSSDVQSNDVLASESTPTNDVDSQNLNAENIGRYTEFGNALKEASEERAQLAKVLAQLTRQVESLESDAINMRSLADLESSTQTDANQQGSSELGRAGEFSQSLGGQERIDSLVSAGIDLQSAEALQARQDQYQLARLELFDQAQREGWIDSEQFSDRLTQLNEQRPDLREELGDDAYDRYLFEAGRSNRVIVASIISGSAAEIAGLEPGDMIIAYAGERIFSTGDLQSATRAGVRGESVDISVNRQGQPLFFNIQRGPMGVTLNQDQQNPS